MNNLFRAFQNVLQSSLPIRVNHTTVEVVTVCNQGFCYLAVTQWHIISKMNGSFKFLMPWRIVVCSSSGTVNEKWLYREIWVYYIHTDDMIDERTKWVTNQWGGNDAYWQGCTQQDNGQVWMLCYVVTIRKRVGGWSVTRDVK